MIRGVAAVGVVLAVVACAPDRSPEIVSARLSYGGGDQAALYFVAQGSDDRLLEVIVGDVAGEFHRTEADADGRTTMQPLTDPPRLAARSPLVFEPGGLHVMVVGLDPAAFSPGEVVEVTFVWERGGRQRLRVPVVDPSAALGGPDG